MKKTILAAIAALGAAMAAEAAVTLYWWTGNGGDGQWNNSANWRIDGGGAGGYPHVSGDDGHCVAFNMGAGTTTTVTLGSGTTEISYIVVQSGTVVLNGAADSVFTPAKTPQIDGNGFVVYKGASLVVNADVSCPSRLDKWRPGSLEFTGDVSVPVTGYSFIIQEGSVVASGSAQLDFTGTVIVGFYNTEDAAACQIATLELADSARLSANGVYTGSDSSTAANGRIVQSGSGSEVVVKTALGLRDFVDANSGESVGGVYELDAGTFVFKSGEAYLTIGDSSRFDVSGGTLCFTGGYGFNPAQKARFSYSGKFGVSVASGQSVTWNWGGCDVAPETVFVLPSDATVEDVDMGGTLSLAGVKSTYGVGLEIGAGKTVTVNKGSSVVRPPNSYEPWKLTLNDGSVLNLAEATTRLALPLDLTVNGTGKILMSSSTSGFGGKSRGAAVAHRLVVDGAAKAKGIYYASANSFVDGIGVASLIVPYVWIGDGADDDWNTPENWEGGSVPPANSPVDLSRAATVTLDDDVSVTCLVAMPNSGVRRTTVAGSGRISLACNESRSCGVFVPEGCELVLDVGFDRTTSNIAYVMGGGRLTLKKSMPTTSGTAPLLGVEGTIALAGDIDFVPYSGSAYNFFSHAGVHPGGYCGEVVIEDGAEFASDRLSEGVSGESNGITVRQTGGKATFGAWYMQNFNKATPAEDLKYALEGGELTVNNAINLGTSAVGNTTRYPGGSFEMTSGKVSCYCFKCGKNQNFVRLSGGEVVFTAAGSNEGALSGTTMGATNKNDYTFYLGGVTIRPTAGGEIASGDIVFTGINGDTVFDISESNYTIASGNEIVGPGGFVVTGAVGKTFYACGTYRNTGSIVLRGGVAMELRDCTLAGPSRIAVEDAGSVLTVYSPVGSSSNPCTIAKNPDVIELAAASCLVVGGGHNLTVKRLVVGGTDYTPGSYTFGPSSAYGTVTVLGAPSSWLVNGVGDLSFERDGATKTLYSAAEISALTNAGASASVTVSGAAITFPAGANIHVAEGDKIVIASDVVVGGEITKTGTGEVVFNGAVTCAGTPSASNDACWILVKEGAATFDGAITGVAVASCGETSVPVVTLKSHCTVSDFGIVLTAYGKSGEACHGETRQKGAAVDYTGGGFSSLVLNNMIPLARPNGGAAKYVMDSGTLTFATHVTAFYGAGTLGEFDFVQNGGTVTLESGTQMRFQRDYTSSKFSYTLGGGKLVVDAAEPFASVSAANTFLNLNGGEIVFARQSSSSYSPFADRASFTVRVGGEVTLNATGTPNTITLPNDFLDDGSDAKRIVTLKGGRFVVSGGMYDMSLSVASGAAVFDCAAASAMDGTLKLVLSRQGKSAVLDYDGQMKIRTLKVGDTGRAKGVYSASVGPDVVRAALDGEGELNVLVNSNSGSAIFMR